MSLKIFSDLPYLVVQIDPNFEVGEGDEVVYPIVLLLGVK